MSNVWLESQDTTWKWGIILKSNKGTIVLGGQEVHWTESRAEKTGTIIDLEPLLLILPENIRTYTYQCLQEHKNVIEKILTLWYEGNELYFRDFLSGPHSEIASQNTELLQEAFLDDRYELVPVIHFANRKLENPQDNVSETSAVVIEFHTRGMAF